MLNALSKMADKAAGEVPTSTPMVPLKDTTKTMHAVEWHGKRNMQYNQVNWRPMITDQRDVLLRVTATSICGSDLHPYKGTMLDMHAGDIMGHEFMGIIEEAGTGVQKLKVGQRVVVAFGIACGTCEYCKREEYTACDTTNPSKLVEGMYGHRPASLYGYSHLCGGVPGGQSEYVRVPFADVNCLVIPDGLLDEQVLFLSDVVPTAYHATELGSVKEGSTVAIWGLGPIGLCAARWAQIRGAKRIIGIDGTPERLAMAKNILKIDTINFKEQDVLKTLFEMEPRGVDTAIEAAGFDFPKTLLHKVEMALTLETDTADILTECITACRKFGTVSIVGVYTGFTNHFPIGAVMEKDLIIKCGQSPTQKYWSYILPKIQSGEFDPTFMITHKGKLSEAPQLYEKFANHEGVIKVFLRP